MQAGPTLQGEQEEKEKPSKRRNSNRGGTREPDQEIPLPEFYQIPSFPDLHEDRQCVHFFPPNRGLYLHLYTFYFQIIGSQGIAKIVHRGPLSFTRFPPMVTPYSGTPKLQMGHWYKCVDHSFI